jgi:hypothetical protein
MWTMGAKMSMRQSGDRHRNRRPVIRVLALLVSLLTAVAIAALRPASPAQAASARPAGPSGPAAGLARAAVTVPSAPTGVTAVAGNTQATVSWTAPSSSGGAAITSYTVTSVPGAVTATAAAGTTSATVTGLTNGTDYRFYVTAANSAGASSPSATSGTVTPVAPSAPDAPVVTNVSARDSAVEVYWSPPDTGAASVTGYVLSVDQGGSQQATVSEPASATSATVAGLANGTDYTFTVTADSDAGNSPASPSSVAVAPRPAGAPLAPLDLQAVAGNAQVSVAWSAPPDGGSAITGYTVSVTPADAGPVPVAAGSTVTTITGLSNGTAYQVSVTAANAAGTSPAAASGQVTPAASIAPGAPGDVSATSTAAGSAQVQWVPPADPGTSAVSSYQLTATTSGGTVASTVTAPASDCSGSSVSCSATMTGLTSTTSYTFGVLATSSAGSGPAADAPAAVTPNVTVKKAPVVLSSASVATLRSLGSDGTLFFEQPPAQVTGLAAGQLVRISPAAAVPDGFLGKVVSVTTQAGLVAVATSPASLPDEYSKIGASLSLPVSSASLQQVTARPGVRLATPTVGGHALGARAATSKAMTAAPNGVNVSFSSTSFTLSLQTDLLEGDSPQGEDEEAESGPMAEIEGGVTVTPYLAASLAMPNAIINVGATIDADVSVKFGVHLKSSKKLLLGTWTDPVALETEIGPQGVAFTLYATLDTDGSVGISFQASYAQKLGVQCTINLTQPGASADTCTGTHSDDGEGLTARSDLYGSMDVKGGLQLGISWQAEDLAGPDVTLTPWLEGTVDSSANPWEDISFGASAGAEFTAFQEWYPGGKSLFSDDEIYKEKLADIWNSGGPFQAMVLSPNVASLAPGDSVGFTATTPAGQVSTESVTWSVVSGPGSIDSSGTYTSGQAGTAVIEADYDGQVARAGIVVSNDVVSPPQSDFYDPTRGLTDAVLASWLAPESGADPSSYVVTAQEIGSGPQGQTGNGSESVAVPAPETYAYLPNLTPGAVYLVTVSAVGSDGRSVADSPETAVPLAPIPGALAGDTSLQNIATEAGIPDKTGVAGSVATVSANGVYGFFLVDGRSPLAPATVYGPGNVYWYLVRKPMNSAGAAEVAYGLDGSLALPGGGGTQPFYPANSSALEASPDGNLVAFDDQDNGPEVYDFSSGTAWTIGAPNGYDTSLLGVADNGTATFLQRDSSTGVDHVYSQAAGGSAQQVDDCTATSDTPCGEYASVSNDGNLIAYEGTEVQESDGGFGSTIDLYNVLAGTTKSLLPANASNGEELDEPVLSGDGTHLAAQFTSSDGTQGLVVVPATGAAISDSNVIAKYNGNTTEAEPVSLDAAGNVLAYRMTNYNQPSPDGTSGGISTYKVWTGGTSAATVPAPAMTDGLTADLTADGSQLVYTLLLPLPDLETGGFQGPVDFYPGVYDWQIP